MRRESSTVVALVGDVTGDMLAGLGRSPNVAVVPVPPGPAATAGTAPRHPGLAGNPAHKLCARRRTGARCT